MNLVSRTLLHILIGVAIGYSISKERVKADAQHYWFVTANVDGHEKAITISSEANFVNSPGIKSAINAIAEKEEVAPDQVIPTSFSYIGFMTKEEFER